MGLAFRDPGRGFQAGAFFRKPLLDNVFNGGANLYEIGGGHGFGFKRLSAHSCVSFPE
jgi:hypothetical protein